MEVGKPLAGRDSRAGSYWLCFYRALGAVMTAKTPAERQREFRARKAAEQAAEVRGIFAHPDDHAQIKAYAAKVAKKRSRHDLER